MIESNFERHTALFKLFRQKIIDPILKGRCSQEMFLEATWLQQQWASNNIAAVNQIAYNKVALLPGSIATALLT